MQLFKTEVGELRKRTFNDGVAHVHLIKIGKTNSLSFFITTIVKIKLFKLWIESFRNFTIVRNRNT